MQTWTNPSGVLPLEAQWDPHLPGALALSPPSGGPGPYSKQGGEQQSSDTLPAKSRLSSLDARTSLQAAPVEIEEVVGKG